MWKIMHLLSNRYITNVWMWQCVRVCVCCNEHADINAKVVPDVKDCFKKYLKADFRDSLTHAHFLHLIYGQNIWILFITILKLVLCTDQNRNQASGRLFFHEPFHQTPENNYVEPSFCSHCRMSSPKPQILCAGESDSLHVWQKGNLR